MCIVVIAHGVVEGYPLVVGANRDELLSRGGEAPRELRAGPRAWGGRDPVAGGTWLGVNEHGLLVALTDRPVAKLDPTLRSRGLLCLDALGMRDAASVAAWLGQELAARRYNPFNLFYADMREAGVACYESELRCTGLPRGLHVLTGGLVDDLRDAKIARAFELLGELPRDLSGAVARLKGVLADRRPGAAEREQICMLGADFGTVSSSIIALGASFPAGTLYLHAPGPPCQASYEDFSRA